MVRETTFNKARKAAYAEVCGFLKDGYMLMLEWWQEDDLFGLIKLRHRTNRNQLMIRVQGNCWSVLKNGTEVK